MRSSLGFVSILLAACSGSSGGPTADAPASIACTSSHEQTADPACDAAPNFVATFASFHPTAGAVDGVPSASFPQPADHAVAVLPAVAVGSCSDVRDATPACVCSQGGYCYPDGTCHGAPYARNHDVGPVSLAVDGTAVGQLAFDGTMYAAQGDLATRTAPIWQAGQHVTASAGSMFSVDGIAPAVPDVTSFAHSIDPQVAPANQDLPLTWTAGSAGDVIEISVGTALTYVDCVAADTGSFTVPWSVFQAISSAGGGGELFVFVDRVRRSVAPSPLGPVALIMRASDSQQLAFTQGR